MLGPPAGFKSRGRPARWLQEWGAARPLASGSPAASGGAGGPPAEAGLVLHSVAPWLGGGRLAVLGSSL